MATGMSFEMATAPGTPDEITTKVLRRAEIAKMTRTLQDKLAYASYKNKNGMTRLSFDVLEAQVAAKSPKKKRRTAAGSVVSSCSSSSSTTTDEQTFSLFPQSSPNSQPLFSDDVFPATEPRGRRPGLHFNNIDDTPTARTRRSKRKILSSGLEAGFQMNKPEGSWKPSTTFCDSSPLQQRLQPDFRTVAGPNISFAIDLPTSPNFGPSSPTSEPELPMHSFQHRPGSPPRTPPPTRRKTHTNTHTSEGAQLLMHLASSPTPAVKTPNPFGKDVANIFSPSTPPHGLSNTPAGLLDASSPGFFNGFGTPLGFNTPGASAFNLADFCNVTPSPAQAAFGSKTPAVNKNQSGTAAGVTSSARRALDFDSLMPPSPSPAKDKEAGLDLGVKVTDRS